MRVIAVEEAFALPLPDGPGFTRTATDQKWIKQWARDLPDFVEHRLPDMDRHGVDVQVLSLNAPGIQAIADPVEAVTRARAANDFLADVIDGHPDRFRGFAALPMQDPDAAARELRRAVEELGFCGALVNDHTNGRYYDAPEYDVVWRTLAELDRPLYLHPGAPPVDSWHVVEGRPELIGPLWTWGAETAAHALRIVLGGVFDRHPGARLVLGHMGESLPFQLARLDSRYGRQRDQVLRRHPSKYFGSNVSITVSGVWSHPALVAAIETLGAQAVLFAIDYPFEFTEEAVGFLRSAPLTDQQLALVAHGNAERLLYIQ